MEFAIALQAKFNQRETRLFEASVFNLIHLLYPIKYEILVIRQI